MPLRPMTWVAMAVVTACLGVAAALLLGSPLAAALLAFAAGAGVAFLTLRALRAVEQGPAIAPAGTADRPTEPALQPGLAELFRAVDEPMLLVRDRRVLAANAPARALLGSHIEGTDVRLAIRHPAAAERLAGAAGEEEETTTRTELAGLGGADRHWTMTATRLA